MRKKIFIFMFLVILTLSYLDFNAYADNSDYKTFSEVIMANGKLLANFTDKEFEECFSKLNKQFFGVSVYIENDNVDATYISNTLWSVTNTSSTDVTYNVKVETETTNKTTFSANSSASAGASGNISGIKGEISAKCGVDYSSQTTKSVKQTETMSLVVEAGSSAIVYLTGNLSITNGVASSYVFFIEVVKGGFEFAILKNQYARVEKARVWKSFIF